MLNFERYVPQEAFSYKERTWIDKELTKAPRWCSVDLRDGNQALIKPMNVDEKIEFFLMLCELGFKEIEVGFPAASSLEFDFIRQLSDRKLIPDDVYIQVITQARRQQIIKTFEAIEDMPRVIFNVYNPISRLQRDVVYHKDAGEVKYIATSAAKLVKELRWEREFEGEFIFEYTAESFSGADMKFALDVCQAVKDK